MGGLCCCEREKCRDESQTDIQPVRLSWNTHSGVLYLNDDDAHSAIVNYDSRANSCHGSTTMESDEVGG